MREFHVGFISIEEGGKSNLILCSFVLELFSLVSSWPVVWQGLLY